MMRRATFELVPNLHSHKVGAEVVSPGRAFVVEAEIAEDGCEATVTIDRVATPDASQFELGMHMGGPGWAVYGLRMRYGGELRIVNAANEVLGAVNALVSDHILDMDMPTDMVTCYITVHGLTERVELGVGDVGRVHYGGSEGLENLIQDVFKYPAGAPHPATIEPPMVAREPENTMPLVATHTKTGGIEDDTKSVLDEDARSTTDELELTYVEDTSVSGSFTNLDDDFLFAREGSGADKLRTLASLVRELYSRALSGGGIPDPPPAVLALGDCPGHMSQALVRKGVPVLGIDMDERHAAPPFLDEAYRTVRDKVAPDKILQQLTTWTHAVGWQDRKLAMVVSDMAVGDRTGRADTDLNVSAARILSKRLDCPAVIKLRDMPAEMLSGAVLKTVGHEPRGIETYLYVPANGMIPPEASPAFAYTVRFLGTRGNTVRVEVHVPEGPLQRLAIHAGLVDAGGEGTFTARAQYYSFVGLRNVLAAAAMNGRSFMRIISTSHTFAHLVGRLRRRRKKPPDGDEWEALQRKFSPRERIFVDNPTRGTLQCSVTMFRTMQARYDDLCKFCALPADGGQNPDLGGLNRRVAFGALLHWPLSATRDELGVDLAYARYKRVLPLGTMYILASRMWYKTIKWYVYGLAHILRRPMHTWELQAVLWALSRVGSQDEREAYMDGLLQQVFQASVVTKRGGARRMGEVKRDAGRMLDVITNVSGSGASLPVALRESVRLLQSTASRRDGRLNVPITPAIPPPPLGGSAAVQAAMAGPRRTTGRRGIG